MPRLGGMSSGELRFLRLPARAWGDLTKNSGTGRFRYVVESTAFTRTWRVALVIADSAVVGAVVVRRYGRPGHGQDGLEFAAAEPFGNPCKWGRLVVAVPEVLRPHLGREDGDPLPPKTGQAVEAALIDLAPGAGHALARIRQLILGPSPPGSRASLLREQRDAVALGLEMAGMDSRELLEGADGDTADLDAPFLQGWNQRRVSEAGMIRHDATSFDEWLSDYATHFDAAAFQDPRDPARRVTVFYADKEALEKQTGTDLLYYRHHRPGFILVQYKRMRARESGAFSAAYYPDEQLHREISRYRGLPVSVPATTVEEWRLTDDAYFIKLVRDDLRKPSENRLVRGMYLPLGLVDLLLKESGEGRRPKGWSTKSVTTYLSNEEFLQLVKQGYIGTRGATTEHLKHVIQGSFDDGRGVVLTVDETDPQQASRLRHA
jgi:hypothetical protein